MKACLDSSPSPAGPLSFATDESGALLALRFDEGSYEDTLEGALERAGFTLSTDLRKTARAKTQLLEYAAGERRTFDLSLVFDGSEWRREVWSALSRIPFGETRTYSQVARMVGRGSSAARAVGSVNAANRLPLVVPCHRVVGSGGSLTGFAGGIHLKERLLAHERRVRRDFYPPT